MTWEKIINDRIKYWENMLKEKNARNIPEYQNFINTQYMYERIHELKELIKLHKTAQERHKTTKE